MSVKTLSTVGPCIALMVSLSVSVVRGQEIQYTTEEYNEYQKAVKDGEDTIIEWIKTHPDSSLKQYALGEYKKLVTGYVDAKKHKETVAAAEKFLESIDPDSFEMVFLATWSAFYSQQYGKAAKYGEKAFELKPDDPNLEHFIPILARSYANIGEQEKSRLYSEKYCASVNPEECYDLLPAIVRHYAEAKKWKSATKYAQMTLKAFEAKERPTQVSEDRWNAFVNEEKSLAHAVIGRDAAENARWDSAEKHYTLSRKFNPKDRARRAEGYFYTGMARWNKQLIDSAMESFARGSFLKGTPHAEVCRKEAERLYKATHGNTLYGFEEYLDHVRSWPES